MDWLHSTAGRKAKRFWTAWKLTDNYQMLVWPVHRSFARQLHKITIICVLHWLWTMLLQKFLPGNVIWTSWWWWWGPVDSLNKSGQLRDTGHGTRDTGHGTRDTRHETHDPLSKIWRQAVNSPSQIISTCSHHSISFKRVKMPLMVGSSFIPIS